MPKQFQYIAHVTKVYDGDTITCDIDCGLSIVLKQQKIRLYGINAPEVKGIEKIEKGGLKARDALADKILNKTIILHTIKDKKGKYGRYLGIVYLDDVNINQWLVDNGYAEIYLDSENLLH